VRLQLGGCHANVRVNLDAQHLLLLKRLQIEKNDGSTKANGL
jgi:hypothetical protein